MFNAFKKTFENLYKEDDRTVALQSDIIWRPDESLWVAFISKDIPVAGLNKNHLLPFFLDKGYKVTQANKGVRLTAVWNDKKIETVIGFNEKEDRMLHGKFSDEDETQDKQDNIIYFKNLFDDLSDHLSVNRCLRSQTYEPANLSIYKGETRPNVVLSKQEEFINSSLDENTFYRNGEANNLVYTVLLSKDPTTQQMIDIMLGFSGDQGLTCKMEGKSTVRSASSELVVQLKLGANEKDMRILEVQNQVSFLGGDKSGKVFTEFCKKLGLKLARSGYLANQQDQPDQPPAAATPSTPPEPSTPTNPLSWSGSSGNAPITPSSSIDKISNTSPGTKQALARKGSSIELQRPGSRGSFLDLGTLSKSTNKLNDEVEIEETKIVVKTHIANVATRNRNSSVPISMVNAQAVAAAHTVTPKEEKKEQGVSTPADSDEEERLR
ncbi:hypothetical protein PROFUN_01433 [Planoprotostelium fungivorum]|uniref:Uncharacterized protein n=1 Tax=Planoprotostelium fungivorum TaxID=1890364 RepID=A0A2P6NTA1_9EUKA|nr:hypothetical protein PROFUN_01433 [Planoprotostelium fungivorum]